MIFLLIKKKKRGARKDSGTLKISGHLLTYFYVYVYFLKINQYTLLIHELNKYLLRDPMWQALTLSVIE